MLYEVLGDIWVVQRNPYLEDDLLDNPKRRGAADRGPAPSPRRDRAAPRSRATRSATHTVRDAARRAARGAVGEVRARLRRRSRRCAQRAARRLVRAHARGQRPLRRPSRASRMSPMPPTGASSTRSSCSRRTPRTRLPALVRACIELGLTIIPRGGGTGYTGGAVPLTPLRGGHQHRKARSPRPGRADARCPAWRRPCRPCITGARRGDAARRWRRPSAAGLVFAVDPTSADASCIGGNIAMNAGGKKAVLWGTALDNLAWWRMVDPDGNWLEVDAPRPQPRQDPRRPAARLRTRLEGRPRRARRGSSAAHRESRDRGRALPQGRPRQGRHRQVPRRPAGRAEGRLRRHHHLGALDPAPHAGAHPHRLPGVLRPGRATPFRRSSRSRDYLETPGTAARRAPRRPRAPRRALPEGRRLRDEVEARRAAEDGAARRHRRRRRRRRRALPPRRSCASPTRAAAKASSRSAPRRARPSGSTAPRTAAIAKHTNAFKINEDVVIPLRAPRRVHRRHRAHQHRAIDRRTSWRCSTRWTSYLAGELRVGKTGDADLDRLPHEDVLGDRPQRGARPDRGDPRALVMAGCAPRPPLAASLRDLERLGLGALREPRSAAIDPGRGLRPAAGPHAARVLEDGGARPNCGSIFAGRAVRAAARRPRRDPPARCCAAASSSRCTCTPATATCTPTSRSTPTTTRCCSRPTGPWRASCASRATSAA